MFKSSPTWGAHEHAVIDADVLADMQKTILIESAYWVPDAMVREALGGAAARRGVNVEIIVARSAYRSAIRSCRRGACDVGAHAAGGCEDLRIPAHDDSLQNVGVMDATNGHPSVHPTWMSDRSGLNDEANLNVLDAGFAAGTVADFRARQVALPADDLRRMEASADLGVVFRPAVPAPAGS